MCKNIIVKLQSNLEDRLDSISKISEIMWSLRNNMSVEILELMI